MFKVNVSCFNPKACTYDKVKINLSTILRNLNNMKSNMVI